MRPVRTRTFYLFIQRTINLFVERTIVAVMATYRPALVLTNNGVVLKRSCGVRLEATGSVYTKRELFVGVDSDERFVRNFRELQRSKTARHS